MAIIYSYPYVSTVNNSDTLVISVSDTTADNGFLTKSLTADNLASYVTARVNLNFLGDTGSGTINLDTQNFTISGTTNEIETSANSQTLQIGLPDNVTITNNLTIGGDFTGDRGTFTNDLNVGADLNVLSGAVESSTLVVNSTAVVSGVLTMEDNINMTQNGRIINLENPINAQDAATKQYVDTAVTGLLEFKGTFRADSGLILSGANAGAYIYNCPGGAGTRVAIAVGDYYIVANTGGNFYCSGDLLQVGDSIVASQDAAADSSTVNDWGILEGDNIEGTGLANTIPLWTDSQVLGNSNITQNPSGSITISENLLVDQREIEASTMIINGVAEIAGELDKAGTKIVGLADPTAAQDAATKAYVDAGNTGQVTGTGTTQTLPLWSDGPAGVLGDSPVVYDPVGHDAAPTVDIVLPGQTFEFRNAGRFITGAMSAGNTFNNATLDIQGDTNGKAATFRGGVIVSTNPGGVQVDNTSVAIGGGGNDIVSGSDHCLLVGNGNQITSNSDQSAAFGQNNTITGSLDSFATGNNNTINSSLRTQAFGFNNTVNSDSSFIAGGDNSVAATNNSFILGYNHTVTGTSTKSFLFGQNITLTGGQSNYAIGTNLDAGAGEHMVIGYRNYPAGYPTPNKNLGLGDTKFIVAVGSGTVTPANNNAVIITEGGINGGSSGTVPQVPRIILPTVPTFSASNDAAADAIGVPEGALYQNNGVVQINRGGGSTTDPLAGGGSGATQTTGTYTPQLIASTPSEWVISSYTIQQGKWVRIGNMVFCDFTIIISASNISGNTGGTSGLTIQGWPYDHNGGAGSFQGGALNQCDGFDIQSTGSNVTLNSGLGNAKLNILKQNTAITNYFVTQNMRTGDLNNGNQISMTGSFSYLTTDSATLNPGATIDT